MERNQIDLVDMKEEAVLYQWNELSIHFDSSKHFQLRPLSRKKSSFVARKLMKIYREHGPPEILQCDNGGEFRKDTKSLCKKIGVKIINSRAYHPQSQGKVERSHRTLRGKIRYDLLRAGTNCVKALPEYQSLLNDEALTGTKLTMSFGEKNDV